MWNMANRIGARLYEHIPYPAARLRLMASLRLSEPELRQIHNLADPSKLSIDIGANWGMYTGMLLRCSRQVVAFEPNVALAALLARAWPRARIESVALGREQGEGVLTVPVMASGVAMNGWASLGKPFEGGENMIKMPVRIARLDDYALRDVGFMKIDVEGHEMEALEGARETIERDRPVLQIEATDTDALADLRAFLAPLGYEASFLSGDAFLPVESGMPDLYSDKRPWSNFIFRSR